MLPLGHIAGGYLAGKLASIAFPELNQPLYLGLSALFGFIPDLDSFFAFLKGKKFTIDESIDHHQFITHTPIFYLFIFGFWYLLFPETRLVAWTFIIGTLSHLVIDTFASDGTQWLYPFSKKLFRFSSDPQIPHPDKKFTEFWLDFIKRYIKLNSFRLEIAFIVISILTLIFSR